MSDATTHLLLPYILAAQAQKHVTHNEALRLLDGLVQLSVLDRDLTAPPGSPTDGDRYIVGSGASGDWMGWDLNVALWTDGAWLRLPPRTGWRAWIEDENVLLVYDGSSWIGTTPTALQNLEMLGIGTTADAANPFSAKLNAALWTARTVGEGGTGDLFYTMNKEAGGDDLGLTLQTAYVTKALLGLFGSDKFRLAVSADGSSFFDGLIVDNANGIVDQPRLPRFKAYTNYDNYVAIDSWTRIGINNTDYNDQGAFDAANKFRRCHDVTKTWEGGWSDHPADPGGKTMYGVTEAVYHAWLRQHGKPLRPVRQITLAEAEQIYFEQYWVPSGGPTLATGVDLATYDASVNSGVLRGRKWLLASIGGPDHETVKRICATRLSFMRSLNIWNTFGRGWARRVADIEAKGVAWALAAANDNSDLVKQQLGDEADKARSQAGKQTGAAAGAGGGGAISIDQSAQLGDWILAGIAFVASAALAFLIIRAVINNHRASAYAHEAANA